MIKGAAKSRMGTVLILMGGLGIVSSGIAAAAATAPTTGSSSSSLPTVCQNNVTAAKNAYTAALNAARYANSQITQPTGIGACLSNLLGMNFSLNYIGMSALISDITSSLENMACSAAQTEWSSAVGSNLPSTNMGWGVPLAGNLANVNTGQYGSGASGYGGAGTLNQGGQIGGSTGSVGGNLFSGSGGGF